jgi:hypothetical protein
MFSDATGKPHSLETERGILSANGGGLMIGFRCAHAIQGVRLLGSSANGGFAVMPWLNGWPETDHV